MKFQRQEAFRYQFGQPLSSTLRIMQWDGEQKRGEKHLWSALVHF
jgi:hypothetical protein